MWRLRRAERVSIIVTRLFADLDRRADGRGRTEEETVNGELTSCQSLASRAAARPA